jgi:DNA-binding response OmpR family regulator
MDTIHKKILVVEDQTDIGALIKLNLETMNFEVTHCESGSEGFALAQTNHFDALILDIMLPGMNGLDICQQLREQGDHTPILMLTAKKSEADRVVGLEVGADDYLTKPFSIRELQARLKALLRRVSFHTESHDQADGDFLRFGDLSIDITKRQIKIYEKELSLTAKEFDLLLYMASYPGKVFTRDQLLNAVWGYQHSGYEHTVNSHINRLRAKIEPDAGAPTYVLTVWGVGYKFYDQ